MPVPAGGDEEVLEPSWRPTGEDVADFVPWRTLTRAEDSVVESDDTYQGAFSSTTTPQGVAVDRLITRAVARVLARVGGTLDATLEQAAATVVCLLVASWIERSWPEDQDAQTRADALLKQAELELDELVEANGVATGTSEYGLDLAPVYSFPVADCRYDNSIYW